jgi:hypothetical protein
MKEMEVSFPFQFIFQTCQTEKVKTIGKTSFASSRPFGYAFQAPPVRREKSDQEIGFTKFLDSHNNRRGNVGVHHDVSDIV